jgi:hypothetical protein
VALPFQLIEGMLGSDAEDCVLRALPRTQDGAVDFATPLRGSIDFLENTKGLADTDPFRSCARTLHEDFLENVGSYQLSALYTWNVSNHMNIPPAFGSSGKFVREVFSPIEKADVEGDESTEALKANLYTGAVATYLASRTEDGGRVSEGSKESEDLLERYRSSLTFILPDTDKWATDFQKWLK